MKLNIKSEIDLKNSIMLSMKKAGVNKRHIANALELSYPTALNKLKHPYTLKVKELKEICLVLHIDFNETLNYKTEL